MRAILIDWFVDVVGNEFFLDFIKLFLNIFSWIRT